MKIAILVHSFPPKHIGGTEIATYEIAKRLGEMGHQIHIVTEQDQGQDSESHENGFIIHRYPIRRIKIIGYALFWMKIIPHLKKIDPDIIHCQGIVMGIPVLFKRWLKKPVIVYQRDNILNQSMEKYFSKTVLKRADTVIALTEYMKRNLQNITPREIKVINNGIHLEKNPPHHPEETRQKAGWDTNHTILISVGRLEEIKGIRYLIDAINIIKRKKLDTKLIIIGDGPQKKDLELQAEKLKLDHYVEFMGSLPHEKVLEYMAASDIFVLPSLNEGFPNVCLEAMASGLPIIATNIGGMSEIVEDGTNGYLVEPQNSVQIAGKVEKLVADNDLREKFANESKMKVKNYELNLIVEKIEKVYLDK